MKNIPNLKSYATYSKFKSFIFLNDKQIIEAEIYPLFNQRVFANILRYNYEQIYLVLLHVKSLKMHHLYNSNP